MTFVSIHETNVGCRFRIEKVDWHKNNEKTAVYSKNTFVELITFHLENSSNTPVLCIVGYTSPTNGFCDSKFEKLKIPFLSCSAHDIVRVRENLVKKELFTHNDEKPISTFNLRQKLIFTNSSTIWFFKFIDESIFPNSDMRLVS
jgi:hypothetical protein